MIDINKLYKEQLPIWSLVKTNYEQMQSIVCKEFIFNGFTIKAQFNPERIRSASAQVDEKSLIQRPCFLCPKNLPETQLGIEYPPHYHILVNPYPIFQEHLTIPDKRHLPQSIEGRMKDMIHLAKDLPGYTLLYNGPQSGASAPDHFHFQAANRNIMPVEKDVFSNKNKTLIKEEKDGSIYYLKKYLRSAFLFESKDTDWLLNQFDGFFRILQSLHSGNDEPKLNILLWYENETGYLVVFPRSQHRPRQFFETEEKQLLVSPGIVDMAGLLIIARKEDFEKLDKELIADIYSQVSISDEEEQKIIEYTNETA
jgi:hypothetical protein